jgi:hypothetical protein
MQLGLSALKFPAAKPIRKPLGVSVPKRKLVFAEDISYSACKGYHKPSCSQSLNVTSLNNGASVQNDCAADTQTPV